MATRDPAIDRHYRTGRKASHQRDSRHALAAACHADRHVGRRAAIWKSLGGSDFMTNPTQAGLDGRVRLSAMAELGWDARQATSLVLCTNFDGG